MINIISSLVAIILAFWNFFEGNMTEATFWLIASVGTRIVHELEELRKKGKL